jgi:1-acyl-sn-glycerol-3-phosphate acyltransferase
VIIFPEGTRSRDGALLPFKKGPFVAAIMLGVPVVPVVCKGTSRIMPKGKYLSILPGVAEIVVLEPIQTAGMSFDDRDRLRDTVRDQIAAELAPDFHHRDTETRRSLCLCVSVVNVFRAR